MRRRQARRWRASRRSGARSARASSRTSAFVASLQRVHDAVLGGGLQAGAPVALVVLVGAGQQRGVAALRAPARRARRRARTCRSSSGPGRWRGSRGGRARRCGRSRARCRCGAATRLAPSSSPGGDGGRDRGDGERACRRARGRRARRRRSSRRRRRTRRRRCRARRSGSSAARSCLVRRRERARPHDLHRLAADARGALAVRVLRREVDDLPVELSDLHTDRLPVDLDREALALAARSGRGGRSARRACSSRAASPRRPRARRRAARARRASKPGRPRFIWIGVVQTSSAPAAKQAAAASGASSGSRSSRLASISETPPAGGLGCRASRGRRSGSARGRACRRRSPSLRGSSAGSGRSDVGERGDERRAGRA